MPCEFGTTLSFENEEDDACGDSDSDVSLSSRDQDRLLKYWESLAPGFQAFGEFFPPTYSELLNSENTEVYIALLPKVMRDHMHYWLSTNPLPEPMRMNVNMHLQVVFMKVYGERDESFMTNVSAVWNAETLEEHHQFVQWFLQSDI